MLPALPSAPFFPSIFVLAVTIVLAVSVRAVCRSRLFPSSHGLSFHQTVSSPTHIPRRLLQTNPSLPAAARHLGLAADSVRPSPPRNPYWTSGLCTSCNPYGRARNNREQILPYDILGERYQGSQEDTCRSLGNETRDAKGHSAALIPASLTQNG